MALTLLAIAYIIYRIVKEACQKSYPTGCMENYMLFNQDKTKVICGQMTQKQLEQNIMNGKYRMR